MRCFLQFGKRKKLLGFWHIRKRSFRGTVYDAWVLPDINFRLLHFRYSLGSFLSPIFNLMTKLFYDKQHQLYHKAETDCLLLTSFIFRKAQCLCPREVPALLSFRLLNGNIGMFASSSFWRVKIYSGVQNFILSLVMDNPKIKEQNSLVGKRTW